MARDFDLPVGIVPMDTVRAADGLALSSRNAYLSPEERAHALGLPRGLFRAADAWRAGERDPERLLAAARTAGLAYDYLALVDPGSFEPAPREGPALLVAAVRAGATRLIDNVLLGE
jgi:pantoate--beta-alanine ligase